MICLMLKVCVLLFYYTGPILIVTVFSTAKEIFMASDEMPDRVY